MQAADIVAGRESGLRIDVKTWNKCFWDEMGRCVAVNQYLALKNKSDAILWCVTPNEMRNNMVVEIAGWNTMEDIGNAPQLFTGAKNNRQVYNHQVDMEKLRPLDALLNACHALRV